MPLPPPGMRPPRDPGEEKKPEITLEFLKRIFSYVVPYKYYMAAVIAVMIVVSVFDLIPPLLTGMIIDDGLIGGNLRMLFILGVLVLGVSAVSNLLNVLRSWLMTLIAQHISLDMKNSMYAHLQRMSHGFFTSNNQGDIITRMTSDIEGIQFVAANTITSVLTNVFTLVFAIIAMYQKNYIAATAGLIIVPLMVIPMHKAGKLRWKLTREAHECQDEINGILNETLSVSGQLLTKLFTNEAYEYERYERLSHRVMRLNIRESLAGRWFGAAMNMITTIGPVMIYLLCGVIIYKYDSSLTVGDVTVLATLLSRVYQPVNSLLNVNVDVVRSMALFSRIFEYFDIEPEIKDSENAIEMKNVAGKISFENVGFEYVKGIKILNDITFDIDSDKCTAIVGQSGIGKSTIVNLILRLYDVTSGRITLDGRDIRDIELASLRSHIGMVTQDSYLFNDTIKANLLYARRDATDSEIEDACRKANIHDFIMSQPHGYDTVVGNRGLKLSGGQKQRLSIARVILKDPEILIFDEATSSLDTLSEKLIQDAIQPLLHERTSIIIAHRLSTIVDADEILVIDDGGIIEHGTHSELLAANGRYAELYNIQKAMP